MKLKKFLPFKNNKGQSLVEFVLLLLVISSISWGFVALMNRSLAQYWEYYANLVINDRPGTKSVNLK
ncbi:MAG: hypothetical protein AB7I27_04495 [Bacteriovoracaceae bacterium]